MGFFYHEIKLLKRIYNSKWKNGKMIIEVCFSHDLERKKGNFYLKTGSLSIASQ